MKPLNRDEFDAKVAARNVALQSILEQLRRMVYSAAPPHNQLHSAVRQVNRAAFKDLLDAYDAASKDLVK